MKVLIVIAHPDDEILGMGGTILKHAKNGDDVVTAYLTTGITSRRSLNYKNSSSYNFSNENSNNTKKQIIDLQSDAKKALKILRAKKSIFFDFPDNEMDSVPLLKIIKKVEKLISKEKPDIVYTSHFKDLNVDHRTVFDAVLTACRPFSFSYDFQPNYFVNIEKELDSKIKAMKIYKNELRKFPHPRSLENIKISAQRWGTVSGFKAAEAFQIIRKFEK